MQRLLKIRTLLYIAIFVQFLLCALLLVKISVSHYWVKKIDDETNLLYKNISEGIDMSQDEINRLRAGKDEMILNVEDSKASADLLLYCVAFSSVIILGLVIGEKKAAANQ